MEFRAVVASRWTPDDYRSRPKDYDPSLADEILLRVENGELLPAILSENRDYPLPGTFLRWCMMDPDLDKRYLEARQLGTEVNLDEMVVASQLKDTFAAGIQSRALKDHIQMTHPSRYGPRAQINVKEGAGNEGGIDYRSEVRRKVEALAEKHAARQASETEESGTGT